MKEEGHKTYKISIAAKIHMQEKHGGAQARIYQQFKKKGGIVEMKLRQTYQKVSAQAKSEGMTVPTWKNENLKKLGHDMVDTKLRIYPGTPSKSLAFCRRCLKTRENVARDRRGQGALMQCTGHPARLITGTKAVWARALKNGEVCKAVEAAGVNLTGLKRLASYSAATLRCMPKARKEKAEQVKDDTPLVSTRRIDANRDRLEKLGHDVVVTDLGDLRKDKRKIAFCRHCFSSRRHILQSGLQCGHGKDRGFNGPARKYWHELVATEHLKLEEYGVRLQKLRALLARPLH
jgi:hypothetical protein